MMTPTFLAQAIEIARRDLRIEGRAGEALTLALPFGALALFLAPLAFGLDLTLLSRIGVAVYWVVGLLFGMQVALRQTAAESPAERDLLALLGVDPAARFTGRVAASSILLVVFLGVLAPLTVVLYAPAAVPGWAWAIPLGVLFALGLALVGTLAGDVATGLRSRTLLSPLLVAPLAAPLLVGASQGLESLRRGGGILTWLLLVMLTDLALAVAGVLTARPLEEATR